MKPTRVKTKRGEKLIYKKAPLEKFMEQTRYGYVSKKKITASNQNVSSEIELTPKQRYVKNFLNSLGGNNKGQPKVKKIIACVLRKSKEYDVDYVQHLVAGITANTDTDFEMVCISDTDVSQWCKWLKFEHNWPSWWCKLELFTHPYLRGKDIVYFDLDTIIQGNITSLVEYQHNFSMLRDFYFRKRFGSGVMAWSGDRSYITEAFKEEVHIKEYVTSENWGDQAFIRDNVKDKIDIIQDVTKVRVASYKNIIKNRNNKLSDCDVLCFHGNPKPRRFNWKP